VAVRLRVTYRKSSIGYSERQKRTVQSLGLRRLGQHIDLDDTPTVRGMVFHVRHLVGVEEIDTVISRHSDCSFPRGIATPRFPRR